MVALGVGSRVAVETCRLWAMSAMGGLAPYGGRCRSTLGGQFAADVGYGMAGPGGRGAGTPWTVDERFDVGVEGTAGRPWLIPRRRGRPRQHGRAGPLDAGARRRERPITATFSGMPAEHDGSEFTFELHFSENPAAGYARLRDQAFTLSGNANVN